MSYNPLFSKQLHEASEAMHSDTAAFEALFKRYFKPLCVFCHYKFGLDPEVAKDVVHNAFIKLWESKERVMDANWVKAYLYRVVTNACLDMIKHEKVKEAYARHVIRNTGESTGRQDHENKDARNDINKAVAELPEQMRKVFMLCRYEDFTYADVAQCLNISVKTVETQMSRALVKLRKKLSHHATGYFIILLSNLP